MWGTRESTSTRVSRIAKTFVGLMSERTLRDECRRRYTHFLKEGK